MEQKNNKNMKIFNATQHDPTPDQQADGVMPACGEIKALITFSACDLLAGKVSLSDRADSVVCTLLAMGAESGSLVMIGGAPYFMAPLISAMKVHGLIPVYSISDRVSVDTLQGDGTVAKATVFKHLGFLKES